MIGAQETKDLLEQLDGNGLTITDYDLLYTRIEAVADYDIDLMLDLEKRVREAVDDDGAEYGVETLVDDLVPHGERLRLIFAENAHLSARYNTETLIEHLLGIASEHLEELGVANEDWKEPLLKPYEQVNYLEDEP